jgi:GTPase SAR1 family protein
VTAVVATKVPLLSDKSKKQRTMADWTFDAGTSPSAQAAAAVSAPPNDEITDRTNVITAKLKTIYRKHVYPVEKRYKYDYFYESPFLTDVEFDGTSRSDCMVNACCCGVQCLYNGVFSRIYSFGSKTAKPQVMLIGQYSVGKTSFIRYLLGRDFPGQRIGPEPTTDRFTVLINGPEERVIPGNALSVHPDLPFRGLERFGVSFLSRFEGSQMPSSVLRSVTLVDTPGILSGEKQRTNRGYDFTKVVAWFAERADLILLLFDAHKLDISDELKGAIDALKGHEDKIRCVLNKADQIDRQQVSRNRETWESGSGVLNMHNYLSNGYQIPFSFAPKVDESVRGFVVESGKNNDLAGSSTSLCWVILARASQDHG